MLVWNVPRPHFLRYLIEWGGLDEVIGAWENIKSTEENIQTSEEALASGVMKGRGGRTYTWKDLTNGKGTPCIPVKRMGTGRKNGYI